MRGASGSIAFIVRKEGGAGDNLRSWRLVLPAALMISVMLLGALIYLIPQPGASEEWPLPPESLPFASLTSRLNSTSFSNYGFFLLSYQPIFSLGSGFDFPAGSNAYLYSVGYENDTYLLLVVAKLPSTQSSLQFGVRAINQLREELPPEKTKYLFTDEMGFLSYGEANQSLSLWYGRSWFFEVLASGPRSEDSISSLKKLISRAYEG